MQPLKARVQNGRLVLDEPTDLPEGTILGVVLIGHGLADGDDPFDEDDREALNRELEASFAAEEAGRLIDAADAIADLRARR
jgi:hypothetical protein